MIEGVGVLSQTPRCMEFMYYTMFPDGDGEGVGILQDEAYSVNY